VIEFFLAGPAFLKNRSRAATALSLSEPEQSDQAQNDFGPTMEAGWFFQRTEHGCIYHAPAQASIR
jgi:hypothetical protein